MKNTQFLQKRPSLDFKNIPPIRVTQPNTHLNNQFISSIFPPNPQTPPYFILTEFNPCLPHISMGFDSYGHAIHQRVRYHNYPHMMKAMPVVTGKEIPGNRYYLKKSPPPKKNEMRRTQNSNEVVTVKRKYRKKGGYALSALQGEFYEKRVMGTQSSRIKDFWKGKTNTYPFTFKQTKVFKQKNQEGLTIILERHRYDFKRVTPNQVDRAKK